MNNSDITDRQQLLGEINRLQLEIQEQGAALGLRFQSPTAVFKTALSLFQNKGLENGPNQEDIFSLLSRFLIPLTLNKTIFSQSGFIVKTLVGLVSQKAAHFVNEGSIEALISKGKGLFDKFIHKHTTDEQV